MHIQPSLHVVSRHVISDGLGTNYTTDHTYAGGKADHDGRGSLGFRQKVTIDSRNNNRTATFYHQYFPLIGLPTVVEVDRASDGAAFRETFHNYFVINSYPSASPPAMFVAPKQLDLIEYEGSLAASRTIRREFSYDSAVNGNLIRAYHHGDIAVSGDERDEVTAWVVDTASWLHRPITKQLKDAAGTLFNEKWIYYDNQNHGALGGFGLVTKEEINTGDIGAPRSRGDPLNAVSNYVNDPQFGVRTSVTDPRQCTTSTESDPTKTFPTKITNCLNHFSELTWDHRYGVKLTAKDSNSQITTSEYDSFGRVLKTWGHWIVQSILQSVTSTITGARSMPPSIPNM